MNIEDVVSVQIDVVTRNTVYIIAGNNPSAVVGGKENIVKRKPGVKTELLSRDL